jgi:transcriptional regulatory protein LevR
MAHVANKLLGVDHAHAVDMPLELSVEDALEKTLEEIKSLDTDKGVLLLVDMGSLKVFGEIATERTGIPTRVVEFVSTPMVIEATRKAMLLGMDLDILEEDVRNISPFVGQSMDSKELKKYSQASGKRLFERMLIDTLGKTLTFLNPEKAYDTLKYTLEGILEDLGEDLNDDMLVKFIFHCSCMIERVLVHEPLPYKNIDLIEMHNRILLDKLKKHFTLAGEVFGVAIPDTEIAYVAKIFDTHIDTQL